MFTTTPKYAVWYASAGCLPDSEWPEFVGTLAECEAWAAEYADHYRRPEVAHDLYGLTIAPIDVDDDE